MSDTFYKPLTPEFRNEINNTIKSNILELGNCQSNAFVNLQLLANNTLKTVINALPDGYPIPMERNK